MQKEQRFRIICLCYYDQPHTLIARAKESFHLSDIVRDFKKFTANQLLPLMQQPPESRSDWMMKRFEFSAKSNARNSNYQLWTHEMSLRITCRQLKRHKYSDENHAIELSTPAFTNQKLDYIHNNPVRAGIVENPQDYLYSSARNYANMKAMIDIDLL